MQTIYYTTTHFVRHTGNVVDLEEYRLSLIHILPADLDYQSIQGLRLEARQKLNDIRPQNLGQASRVSGVSPADVAVLMVYLKQNNSI